MKYQNKHNKNKQSRVFTTPTCYFHRKSFQNNFCNVHELGKLYKRKLGLHLYMKVKEGKVLEFSYMYRLFGGQPPGQV